MSIAMMTSEDGDTLRSRPMAACQKDFTGTLWFFTHAKSAKVQEVADDSRVCVSYADADAQNYVSLSGRARLVHDREAHADVYALLQKYRPKGIVHCYSGSADDALRLVKQGMYIGFGGALTFKNAKRAIEAAAALPLEAIVLETDCPYMAPEGFRGKRCDSSMIAVTAARLAEIKQLPLAEVLRVSEENARRLFSL